jgi:hypothetical protein
MKIKTTTSTHRQKDVDTIIHAHTVMKQSKMLSMNKPQLPEAIRVCIYKLICWPTILEVMTVSHFISKLQTPIRTASSMSQKYTRDDFTATEIYQWCSHLE